MSMFGSRKQTTIKSYVLN